jgi:hypothetical protein
MQVENIINKTDSRLYNPELKVSLILPKHIDIFWPRVKDLLKKSVRFTYGRYTLDDIHDVLSSGEYQLWVVYEGDEFIAAIATTITQYPQRKCLCIHFIGGTQLSEWKDKFLFKLRGFARDMKCDGIEATGRPGWVKHIVNQNKAKVRFVTFDLPIHEENA